MLSAPSAVHANEPNRVLRVDIRPRSGYTRFLFKLNRGEEGAFTTQTGRRLVIGFRDTDGPLYRKFRNYAGPHVAGINFSRRRGDLLATLNLTGDNYGVRVTSLAADEVVTLDIGPAVKDAPPAGRERLWTGVERLVRQLDPPLSAEIPFVPTQRKDLPAAMSEEMKKLFLAGEGSLYKGRGAEAEAIFQQLVSIEGSMQGMAAFRLGEARYLLQNYSGALDAFRLGERIQPGLAKHNPGADFYFADSLMRTGDYRGGRGRMQQLVADHAEQPYAPLLLVRLADTMSRHGERMEALNIYRTVVERYAGHKGGYLAALKLADNRFFEVGPLSYMPLAAEYRRLGKTPHPLVREEAQFKASLISSLMGPVEEGLENVVEYEKRYGRGMYAGVAREMREELVYLGYLKRLGGKDCAGLSRLVLDNRAYLARSLADRLFLTNLSACFASLGELRNEMILFIYLAEREWGAIERPYLLARIAEDALSLGDLALAERSGREFLEKYPRDARISQVRECLGAVCYQKKEFPGVIAQLGWLIAAKSGSARPESYYYLGKAYEGRGEMPAAERAVSAFLDRLQQSGKSSPYHVDAVLLLVNAKQRRGDIAGAMAACRGGMVKAGAEGAEAFAYKMGELLRQSGQIEEARSRWQKLAGEGKDPVWRKLASQQLADMEWWGKVGGGLRGQNNGVSQKK